MALNYDETKKLWELVDRVDAIADRVKSKWPKSEINLWADLDILAAAIADAFDLDEKFNEKRYANADRASLQIVSG
jgi:hypothetical protein